MSMSRAWALVVLTSWLVLSGCASQRGAAVPAPADGVAPPAAPPVAAAPEPVDVQAPPASAVAGAATGEVQPSPVATPQAPRPKPTLREICRLPKPGEEAFIDATRRRVQETVCGANLWFDGLFGGPPDIQNARAVSGVLEASDLYSEFRGNALKVRLRANYDLANLKNRVNLFLGRGDDREVIEDRIVGLAVRSSIFGLESRDEWLAGLGYSPPGRLGDRFDFRLGARIKSSPEVYVQGRYRRDVAVGEKSAVRFRETVFWENRQDGFGSTTSVDVDRLINPRLLLRWANVATVSQSTEGALWRTSFLVYQNIDHRRALLYQAFVRGETAATVPLREFGTQVVFRMPIGRTWLFGNFTVGYSWPRFERVDRREGSALVGFGIELLFGRDPY